MQREEENLRTLPLTSPTHGYLFFFFFFFSLVTFSIPFVDPSSTSGGQEENGGRNEQLRLDPVRCGEETDSCSREVSSMRGGPGPGRTSQMLPAWAGRGRLSPAASLMGSFPPGRGSHLFSAGSAQAQVANI